MFQISARQVVILSIALLLIYLALAYAFYVGVASKVLGANDFYSRWMGARALFLDGQDPYSDAVTRQIQMGMYGRLARPDEDQVAFAYPLYATFFTLPFIALPYAFAESFWIALLIMIVVSAGIVLARLFSWPLSPVGLLLLIAFVLTFYPTLRGIFLGQFILLVFTSLALGLWLMMRGYDEWAGWVLAVSSVKPHIAILALAVILSWSFMQRRWRLIRGFVSGMAVLVLSATLLLPSWPREFIGALGAYQSYIQIGPPIQVLGELLLPAAWAGIVALAFSVLLFGVLFYRWLRTIGSDWIGFLPTVELAMIVTTMVMIRTATTDQTMLLIPWIHWFSRLARDGRGKWAVLIGSVLIVLPWSVFLSTVQGNQEAPIATTTAALLTLIAYVIIYRRDWIRVRRVGTAENVAT